MKKVAVITDSTSYIPQKLREQLAIDVIPLNVIWGDESYADGIEITPEEFYTRLASSSELPSTSQPSVAAFEDVFKRHLDDDQDIIAILISSGISGTVHSALQAKKILDTERIQIVDSKTAAMAAGLHVLAAARAADQGETLQNCLEIARKAQEKTEVVFAVDTLEFLHKGGRIGGAKRLLGSMLNIKPILEMRGGLIEPVDQVRTQRRAMDALIALTEERAGNEAPLRMSVIHSNVPRLAEEFKQEVSAKFSPEEIYLAELSPVIGTHVGPGTLALACMRGI